MSYSKVLQAAAIGKGLIGLISAYHFAQMMPYMTMLAFGMAAVIMFGISTVDGLTPAVHIKATEVGGVKLGAGAVFMWLCVIFLHSMSVYTSTLSFQRGVEQRQIDERSTVGDSKIAKMAEADLAIAQHEIYGLGKAGKIGSDEYNAAQERRTEAQNRLDDMNGSATAAVLKTDAAVWRWSFLMALMLEAIYLALGIGTGLYRYLLDVESMGGVRTTKPDITTPAPKTKPKPPPKTKAIQGPKKAANDLDYIPLKKPELVTLAARVEGKSVQKKISQPAVSIKPKPKPVQTPKKATSQTKPKAPQATASKPVTSTDPKPDRAPQRKRAANYQRRKAKAQAMLLSGACKPSVRGVGQAVECNNQAAANIIADLVTDGVLIRQGNGQVKLTSVA